MKSPTRLAIEAALAGIDTAKSGDAYDRVKAREHYEFVAMDCDMRQLLQEHDARVKVLEDALNAMLTALVKAEEGCDPPSWAGYENGLGEEFGQALDIAIKNSRAALNQSPKE